MTDESIVVEETKRQTVILLYSAVGTLVTMWIITNMTTPDAWDTAKMKISLALKKFAMKRADFWLGVTDRADRFYERNRNL